MHHSAPTWRGRLRGGVVAVAALLLTFVATALRACPFCPAVEPTFADQRAVADWAALVEVVARSDSAGPKGETVRVRQLLKGDDPPVGGTLEIDDAGEHPVGALLLVLRADGGDGAVRWTTRTVDELGYAYFYRAPSPREPMAKRLRYYAPYLEHRDPAIAADAFAEFAAADYDHVAAVADAFDMARVRQWIADPNVSPRRKGFYGMVLGLADDAADRAANARLLKKQITADEDDFRAGFDGLLAGYLLLEGEAGLDLVDARFLRADPAKSRPGDTRHAMSALRFYQEFCDGIPEARLSQSLRLLLARPEFAAAAIVDLARWQDWGTRSGRRLLGRPRRRRAGHEPRCRRLSFGQPHGGSGGRTGPGCAASSPTASRRPRASWNSSAAACPVAAE
ncbi:MAG: hypothetical protein R3C10_03375 [Pirellulales bacterium]